MKKVIATNKRAKKQGLEKSNLGKGVADLITQTEAARLRGTTRAAIGDLIQRGRLRSIYLFGKRLVYRNEVIRFKKDKPGPRAKD